MIHEPQAAAEALRSLISTASVDVLCARYSPDVSLVAYLAGETLHAEGRDAVCAAIASWHPRGAPIMSWDARAYPDEAGLVAGLEIDVEWRPAERDGPLRRRHYMHLDERGRVHRHIAFAARPPRRSPPAGEPGPALQALRHADATCEPVGGGYSGAFLERITPDFGPPVVVKYLAPHSAWQARATDDSGREARLYLDGMMDQLPRTLSHAVLAAEPYGQGWAVITRDLRGQLMPHPAGRPSLRGYLAALHDLHLAVPDVPASTPLATVAQRWGLWWPGTIGQEYENCDAQPKQIARGWDVLPQVVPADVVSVVTQIAADPGPVAAAVAEYGHGLLHGDAHLGNVAAAPAGFTLLDWGLATAGPPAVEAAWLANFAQQYTCGVDDMLSDVADIWHLPRQHRSLNLALLGQASSVIPALASPAVDYPDPAHRRRTAAKVDWWVAAVRSAAHLLP